MKKFIVLLLVFAFVGVIAFCSVFTPFSLTKSTTASAETTLPLQRGSLYWVDTIYPQTSLYNQFFYSANMGYFISDNLSGGVPTSVDDMYNLNEIRYTFYYSGGSIQYYIMTFVGGGLTYSINYYPSDGHMTYSQNLNNVITNGTYKVANSATYSDYLYFVPSNDNFGQNLDTAANAIVLIINTVALSSTFERSGYLSNAPQIEDLSLGGVFDNLLYNNGVYSHSLSAWSDLSIWRLVNASEHLFNDQSYCRLHVTYVYDDTSTRSIDINISPADDGEFYYMPFASVVFVDGADYPVPEYFLLSYVGYVNSIDDIYDVNPSIDLGRRRLFNQAQYNWSVFYNSPQYQNAFGVGYAEGLVVGEQNADTNNLGNLLWVVIDLPFRLLFGTYDTDSNSSTYGQYVGGLFNLTILGLDLRAFVLSVLSLCLVIAIIKVVMGMRR